MNREELAWAAGLVDGEGCFHLRNKRNPVFAVGQTNDYVLYRLRSALNQGTIRGPYTRKYADAYTRKPSYDFEVNGFEKVQAVLALLWTWLSPIKRQQAQAVLKFRF